MRKQMFQNVTALLLAMSVGTIVYAESSNNQAPAVLKQDPAVLRPPEGQLPRALVALSPESPYALLVDKGYRTLTLWKWTGDKPALVGAYPTDIGQNNGDKISEGDKKTPEGVYFFQRIHEKNEIDYNLYGIRAFETDYPNYFDRLEHKTGKGIWLHAIPETQTLYRGSKGCVVVRNSVIDALTPYITLKETPMVVQSHVDYISETEWKSEREKIFNWVDKWRAAWETKDISNYMKYYGDKFKSMGMNKAKWQRYKSALNDRYKYIKVHLLHVQAFKHGDKFMIRFLQQYESDQKQDFGEKTLYVQDSTDGLAIVGEEWGAKAENAVASTSDATSVVKSSSSN